VGGVGLVGCGLGHLGHSGLRPEREKERREMGCAQGEGERGFSLYFFSGFYFSFQNQISNYFESGLNSNFAEKILNTHGLIK
jgi:hypothetical protein